METRDRFDRPLRSLRLSVTDRCNLRCQYCMPEADYVWLPREDLLTFDEMTRLVDVFIAAGVDRVRLTGGEPLLRSELERLIEQLAQRPMLRDIALTTNAVLLASRASALKAAGLHRVTISLDTLRPDRFLFLTRFDEHTSVLKGIESAMAVFGALKLDTVVIRGVNDDELVELLEYAKRLPAEIRFIEYMDVGGATRWTMDTVVTRHEILARIERQFGPAVPLVEHTSAPADRFQLPDGTIFGIISSTTQPFCLDCDRSRVTADGMWFSCLYATQGTDLRSPLRRGASSDAVLELVTSVWRARADRGAELRLRSDRSGPFIPLKALRVDSHLEMHTRGG